MATDLIQFHVGRFGHPFFAEQLRCAPEGYAYRGDEQPLTARRPTGPRRIVLQGSRLRPLRERLERSAVHGLSWFGHVRQASVMPLEGCSLIHSAQLLLREPALPYVVDFECLEVFCLYQRMALGRPWARWRLLEALEDERCRFLLPWSQAAYRGIAAALGQEGAARLAHKTVTVPPAIHARVARPVQRDTGPLRVLFVGTAFYAKGGVEAVKAINRVRSTHDVVLDLVSDVPDEWRRQTAEGAGIKAHAWPVSAEQLHHLFDAAHLLLFPSHMDTLGFVVLEAMANGLPVLATRHFAVPELVEDGVSGVLVEAENPLYGEDGLCRFTRTLPPPRAFRRSLASPSDAYVDRLAQALARLAEDRDLHGRLSVGALTRVTDGALSPLRRQETLRRVYNEALAA